MKQLPRPVVDDNQVITQVANNRNITTSYPFLFDSLNQILLQYQHYDENNGNALNINRIDISDDVKRGLLSNYKSPPKAASFIKAMRDSIDDVCAMCGSKSPFTLDHILPKEQYPEWAIYSKNLVPACSCNVKRGTKTLGRRGSQERVIHPYFDKIFASRQVSCKLLLANDFNDLELNIITLQPQHPNIEAINFHIEKIVKPAGIEKYLKQTCWSKLVTKPSLVIQGLYKQKVLTTQQLKDIVNRELEWYDEQTGTMNNWDSIFLHGLLMSEGVIDWVANRHNETVIQRQ